MKIGKTDKKLIRYNFVRNSIGMVGYLSGNSYMVTDKSDAVIYRTSYYFLFPFGR